MKWFEKSYRRHLLDMHIDDWDPVFLSEFSPEDYVANIKKANIQSPMIYFQSHVGHCYWPTKTGHMHGALKGREDLVKRLVDLCHKEGMDVIGYYSPIFDSLTHDRHPAWRMRRLDGTSEREAGDSRYGLLCPNNMEYRAFVKAQIEEMVAYFDFEGMFYDMPFYPHYCYCDSCKARWEQECGGNIPTDKQDERWFLFEEKRKQWIGEFAQFLTDTTKALVPDVSIEQNYANAALELAHLAIGEGVNAACDYVGGDIYKTFLTQSFACKFYHAVTRHQPFEFMTGRCEPDLTSHTVTKSADKLTQAVMLTCAHHGANLIIDAIDPVGTMNPAVYDLIGELFAKEKAYEPYLTGDLVANVGVYYSMSSKANLQGQSHTNYTGTQNTIATMIRQHIPVGIVSTENRDNLSNYPFVILPNPNHLPEKTVDALINYVKNGGTLYFSNTDERRLFDELVGGVAKGYTEHTATYIAPKDAYRDMLGGYTEKYPLSFRCRLPIVEGIPDEQVAATIVLPYTLPEEDRFSSIHSNPPGVPTAHPALVIKNYGKGTVIWSAAPLENEPGYSYRQILTNLVRYYIGENIMVNSNAPKTVELVTFSDEQAKAMYVSAVTLSDEDTAVTQPPFQICVKTDKRIRAVELLPDKVAVPFEQTSNQIVFETRPLHIFDMYRLIW